MAASNVSPAAQLLILDSIGYVAQANFEIAGKIIVSGSHGGTAAAGYILDHPQKPRLVFFNDAGGGKDQAGIAGLELLEKVQVPACTYSHLSARIGLAQDGLDHGVISYCNEQFVAMALGDGIISNAAGSLIGTPVRELILLLLQNATCERTSPKARGKEPLSIDQAEPDPHGPPLRRFKDPKYVSKANSLSGIRAGIDTLDEQIIALLAERAMLVKDAARFKANHFQVSAPQRQAEVFAKARQRAIRHNLGFEGFEDVVEQAYRTLVAQFIAKESLYFDQLLPIDG